MVPPFALAASRGRSRLILSCDEYDEWGAVSIGGALPTLLLAAAMPLATAADPLLVPAAAAPPVAGGALEVAAAAGGSRPRRPSPRATAAATIRSTKAP